MLEILLDHSQKLIFYLILFFYLYFVGRAFLILINYIITKNYIYEERLFKIRTKTLFPLIGVAIVSNLLFLINFIYPLDVPITYVLLFLLLLPNLKYFRKPQNILRIRNLFLYLLIPSILIISFYDTSWHYDAGFYHLNNQNWLRNFPIIQGFVNIHWAFGMSSIYEYISSILWINGSFIFLHLLNIVFVHFFFSFIYDMILHSKNAALITSGYLLLIFSYLDNIGLDGGRNGFIYFQGVTKQDTPVAVLFLFISISAFLIMKEKNVKKEELIVLSLLTLFTTQIKLSGVTLIVLYILLISFLFFNKVKNLSFLLRASSLSIILGLFWTLKSVITTGCLVFPVNRTCFNGFDWYLKDSTITYEAITREASYSLSKYDYNFTIWTSEIFSFQINRVVGINFLISFIIISLTFILFFNKESLSKNLIYIILFYVIINIFYLILYGPTPRYSMGFFLFLISLFGFFSKSQKVNFNNATVIFLIILSVIFLVRKSSYEAFLNNKDPILFDPRELAVYVLNDNGYVKPDIGDQCWININCTMNNNEIIIKRNALFLTAYNK